MACKQQLEDSVQNCTIKHLGFVKIPLTEKSQVRDCQCVSSVCDTWSGVQMFRSPMEKENYKTDVHLSTNKYQTSKRLEMRRGLIMEQN